MSHWGPIRAVDRVMGDTLAGLLEELAKQMRQSTRIEEVTRHALWTLAMIHEYLNTLVAPEGPPNLLAILDQQAAELRDALAKVRADQGEGEAQSDSTTPEFPNLE